MSVIELFAGPGGWSEGARPLRLDPLGFDISADACATALAAGHQRIRADVADLTPTAHEGLIASPPCQGWSLAGKGTSRRDAGLLLSAIEKATPANIDTLIAGLHERMADDRSVLVLEPLRWALLGAPRWCAWEQVPSVAPIWAACAATLERHGYHTWVGVLSAEQHGVPQTRKRAIFMAHRDREVRPPTPTHSRYYPRDPTRLDQGVLPWVSMADALGTVDALRSNYGTGGDARKRGVRGPDQPAPTVTSKVNRNLWVPVPAVPGDTSWTRVRPSPTIVGSFAPDVVAAPGWRKAGDGPRQSQPGSVRVSVEQAGVLQSFPPDYPWQGSRSSQYQQCGDAIPPLLARAILGVLA